MIRFGETSKKSGVLSFEGMSDEQLLDQYEGLIGGRGWFTSDAEDAKKLKQILQNKYKDALALQKQQEELQKKLIEERKRRQKEEKRLA